MNNKEIGTEFEHEVCEYLKANGYWIHFMTPDKRGAQPFDIIAVKNSTAIAVECKTLSTSRRYFTIDRLEDNQIMAFEQWEKMGNDSPLIWIKYGNSVKIVTYDELKKCEKIDMKGKSK